LEESSFVYFDESIFYVKKRERRFWSSKKKRICHPNKKNLKPYKLLLAISSDDLVHYKIHDESTTQFTIIDFLAKLKSNFLLSDRLKEKFKQNKIIILLDNASWHTTHKVRNWCKRNSMNLFYNIPNFPKYNIIEEVFAYLKNGFYNQIFRRR